MDYVAKLMRVYRGLVTDPAWRREQERKDAERLKRGRPSKNSPK